MADNMNKRLVIPVFIPHMGCKNDCIFCNQRSISGENHKMTLVKAKSTIEEYLKHTEKFSNIEIAFFGGSFTGIPINNQIDFLDLAQSYIDKGLVDSIRMSTRPDYINEDILDFLKHYSVEMIELGAQSLDEDVLRISKRGHTSQDVINASNLIKKYGINLGIQTMIGLPQDTWEKSLNTAKRVIEIMPSTIRIYPALVVKNTELYNMYKKGEYKPLALNEAVKWVSELILLYENAGVDIARIGLQSTENIQLGMDVVAGPFHNAIRQLSESYIMHNIIENKLKDLNIKFSAHSGLVINCSNKNVSNVIGQKKSNINSLKKQFGFKFIKVNADNTLKNREIKVSIKV